MSELDDYERRFRRAGLPLFIEDYSAREDVWTRSASERRRSRADPEDIGASL